MSDETLDVWSELFARRGRVRRLGAGEALFCRGEPADQVFRVRSGAVRLERVAADGSQVTILVARSSETLAEASLFAERYHCDARAEARAVVECLPAALLRQRLVEEPELALRLVARLCAQLREARAMLELRGSRSARERVLRYLALFGSGIAEGEVALQTVAHQIGLRPETLYRTLAGLDRSGLVARRGRRVWLAADSSPDRVPPASARGRSRRT
jgi:CRP/FNR family transcriptional regulator